LVDHIAKLQSNLKLLVACDGGTPIKAVNGIYLELAGVHSSLLEETSKLESVLLENTDGVQDLIAEITSNYTTSELAKATGWFDYMDSSALKYSTDDYYKVFWEKLKYADFLWFTMQKNLAEWRLSEGSRFFLKQNIFRTASFVEFKQDLKLVNRQVKASNAVFNKALGGCGIISKFPGGPIGGQFTKLPAEQPACLDLEEPLGKRDILAFWNYRNALAQKAWAGRMLNNWVLFGLVSDALVAVCDDLIGSFAFTKDHYIRHYAQFGVFENRKSFTSADFNFIDLSGELVQGGALVESYMVDVLDLALGQLRLLEVDERICLPEFSYVRLLISSDDVLHSWAVPALGVKVDACPGRLNELFVFLRKRGVFYGQCSEICGFLHGFMPVVVEVVSKSGYYSFNGLAALVSSGVVFTQRILNFPFFV
jgi:heme/copper-type cytochrome/quinol oxidase subunit 2